MAVAGENTVEELADALRTGRLYIFFGAAAAGLFLYLALFGLARRADALIRTQRERLVEAEILAAVGEMSSAVAHGIRAYRRRGGHGTRVDGRWRFTRRSAPSTGGESQDTRDTAS